MVLIWKRALTDAQMAIIIAMEDDKRSAHIDSLASKSFTRYHVDHHRSLSVIAYAFVSVEASCIELQWRHN